MAPSLAAMSSEETVAPVVGSQAKSSPEPLKETACAQRVIQDSSHVSLADPISNTDSPYSEDPFCRICHEGGGVEDLLSPCECTGSLATVHRSCVEHWLTASNTSRCELCHFEFALERLPKPLTEWLHTPSTQHQRRTFCGDAICFMFITPLASLSGWLCVQGAMDLYYSNSMEAVGLVLLTLALFAIYLFWTTVSLRYHIHLFETWRKTNQKVRLQIPRPAVLANRQPAFPTRLLNTDSNKETVV